MRWKKQTIGHIPKVYSLAALPGGNGFVAGSETEGPLLYWPSRESAPVTIATAPGGFISLWCFEYHGRPHVLASNNFKPGFNAADCHIVVYPLDRGECPPPLVDFPLPYTHRVALVEIAGQLCFLASTLCESKSDPQDWSRPGGIHLAVIPPTLTGPWPLRQIVPSLTKNHGMDLACLHAGQSQGMLLSAQEGLAFLPFPETPKGDWSIQWISGRPTSDAFAADLRCAGQPDIFAISPFHGNELGVYRREGDTWKYTVIDERLAMGHVVWSGEMLGKPMLVVADRRERRALRLYHPIDPAATKFDCQIIEEDIGPSQILVDGKQGALIVAAHNHDAVLRYQLNA